MLCFCCILLLMLGRRAGLAVPYYLVLSFAGSLATLPFWPDLGGTWRRAGTILGILPRIPTSMACLSGTIYGIWPTLTARLYYYFCGTLAARPYPFAIISHTFSADRYSTFWIYAVPWLEPFDGLYPYIYGTTLRKDPIDDLAYLLIGGRWDLILAWRTIPFCRRTL